MDLIRMRRNLHSMWLGYGAGAGQVLRTPGVFMGAYRFGRQNLGDAPHAFVRSLRYGMGEAATNLWHTLGMSFAGDNRAYGLGVLGSFATPMIAGAAAFSGLVNLARGRQGRGLALLALGAGLTAGMYGASMFARSGTAALVPVRSGV